MRVNYNFCWGTDKCLKSHYSVWTWIRIHRGSPLELIYSKGILSNNFSRACQYFLFQSNFFFVSIKFYSILSSAFSLASYAHFDNLKSNHFQFLSTRQLCSNLTNLVKLSNQFHLLENLNTVGIWITNIQIMDPVDMDRSLKGPKTKCR